MGRAFGSLPNALACGVKIGGAEVFAGKALLGKVSKANKRCHENVVVLSDSRASEMFLDNLFARFYTRPISFSLQPRTCEDPTGAIVPRMHNLKRS